MQEKIDVHKVFAEYFKGCEALAYALSSKLSEGNICIDINKYSGDLPKMLEEQGSGEWWKEDDRIFLDSPAAFLQQCQPGKFVTSSPDEFKPFIIIDDRAYLNRYYKYETEIIDSIERLGSRFHIITGGPGTGKTYSVAQKLVQMLGENPSLKVALAAPTGKAAARMTESIHDFLHKNTVSNDIKEKLGSIGSTTLHRLLGWIRDSVFFRYNEKYRLPFDVVIIDECSMIDGAMMAKLLQAVGENTELFLLGDKDQLASIEAGSVFGDLCRSGESKLLNGKVELKKNSYRFERDKGIGRLSREIIEGALIDISEFKGDEQVIIDTGYNKELFRDYALLYLDYILEEDIEKALRKLNNVRFLCVTRESDNSVAEINKRIAWLLRAALIQLREEGKITNDKIVSPKNGFYHNQPVIITKNDYNLRLNNGDTGIIRYEDAIPYAYFETAEAGIRKIQAGFLNDFETAFAMTIHKSQGSEFDNVVIVMPMKRGEKLLTRELLYTAVTRAKNKVIIQSSEEVITRCASNKVSRASGIQQRLIPS